jgi:hypothetical protein
MRPYRNITALIELDGRDEKLAKKALMLAHAHQAKLAFLHLIPPDGELEGGYPALSPRAQSQQLEIAATRRLEFMAGCLGADEARCIALYGSARECFEHHAHECQPDLVVSNSAHNYLEGPHDLLILAPAQNPMPGRVLRSLIDMLGLKRQTALK